MVRQISQSQPHRLECISLHHEGEDLLSLLQNGCADIRKQDPVSVLKRKGSLSDQKRKHAPVDQVGTVPLCRIVEGDVAPSAKHLLAGCRLFPGRAVSRFDCEDRRSDPEFLPVGLLIQKSGKSVIQDGKYMLQLCAEIFGAFFRCRCLGSQCFHRILSLFDRLLGGLDFFGPADICRILAGEGKLGKSQRVAAV